jgi:hypothetical protein
LEKFFKIKDLGKIARYVGLEVKHTVEGIKLTQTHYIEKMQKRFLLKEFKPVSLPAPSKQKLTIDDCPRNDAERKEVENLPFRAVIGSELYAALGSRPDVAYYVIATAKFCESFGDVHFNAALRILKYLVTTKSKGLFYPKNGKPTVKIYVDSDWAENVDDRKSIGGWACYFSDCLISWSSSRQNIVAKSSCEAEYIAAGDAVGEALWLQQLLSELRIEIEGKVTIFIDNKAAMGLAKNPIDHKRTKHIHLRYHFIRDHILKEDIVLVYIPTAENIADLFTKATSFAIFQTLVGNLVR